MNNLICKILAAGMAFSLGAKADGNLFTTTGGTYELVVNMSELNHRDLVIMASHTRFSATEEKVVAMTTKSTKKSGGFDGYSVADYTGAMPTMITIGEVNKDEKPYEFSHEYYTDGDASSDYRKFADIDGQWLSHGGNSETWTMTFEASYNNTNSRWEIYPYKGYATIRTATAKTTTIRNLVCKDSESTYASQNGCFHNNSITTKGVNPVYFYRKLSLVITDAGYATLYYGSKAVKVPDGVTAFTYAMSDERLEVSHTFFSGEWIPAGTAVVLKGNPGSYPLVLADADGAFAGENVLRGFDTDSTPSGDGVYYMLAKGSDGVVGFCYGAEGGAPFVSKAHKAYLRLPASASQHSFWNAE